MYRTGAAEEHYAQSNQGKQEFINKHVVKSNTMTVISGYARVIGSTVQS